MMSKVKEALDTLVWHMTQTPNKEGAHKSEAEHSIRSAVVEEILAGFPEVKEIPDGKKIIAISRSPFSSLKLKRIAAAIGFNRAIDLCKKAVEQKRKGGIDGKAKH
jgi:hypothetical protein